MARLLLAILGFAVGAAIMARSDTVMQFAASALGISETSSKSLSFSDYNPLTLTSPERLKKLVNSDAGIPKMEPIQPLKDFESDQSSLGGFRAPPAAIRLGN